MEKSSLVYLDHIAQCIAKINEYTNGFNEERFLKNNLV